MKCHKIFIIEDDRDIRECFRMTLESEGYSTESFENGRDAIARLDHSAEPCLILLDFMMPVMNGTEFMKKFAKFPTTVIPTPVFLCTAGGTEKDSISMGCCGFIKKPVDLDILLMIVQKHCQKYVNDAPARVAS